MAWCDPCADDPLTTKELFQAGAFWIGGDPTKNFSRLLNGAGVQVQDSVSPPNPTLNSRGQPALLTRLHLRYTPESFAEDLMFIQTSDRTNWQTRYVIHTPFPGSVSDCQAKAASNNCKAYCQDLASSNSNDKEWKTEDDQDKDKDKEYVMECTQRCTKHNWKAVQEAVQYYQTALPARIKAEKNTLAELTGWSMAEIDAMPGSLESSLPVSNGQSGKDGQSARLWKPRR